MKKAIVAFAGIGGAAIGYYAYRHPESRWLYLVGLLCLSTAIWPAWGARLWRRLRH
jgi:hypothetical protein